MNLIRKRIWYIKDYERMAEDYSCVLDHATCGKVSKTNYSSGDICQCIDDSQIEDYGSMFHYDIMIIINSKKSDKDKLREISEYRKEFA